MKIDKLIDELNRKSKGLKKTQLAQIAEMSESAIGDWVRKRTIPRTQIAIAGFVRLFNFFKIDIGSFLDFDDFETRLLYLSFLKKETACSICFNAGAGTSLFSTWVSRTEKPNGNHVKKIADYCGVTPEWILHGDKKEPLRNGLIDLPVVEEKQESVIFTAKPKAQVGNFIKLDNGMIADISTGKTFTMEQFNKLFEVA